MKKASGIFQYYVEGDDEKRVIEVLKTDMRLIIPGKVQILNVVQERLTDLKLRTLQDGTTLVFVFDKLSINSLEKTPPKFNSLQNRTIRLFIKSIFSHENTLNTHYLLFA